MGGHAHMKLGVPAAFLLFFFGCTSSSAAAATASQFFLRAAFGFGFDVAATAAVSGGCWLIENKIRG